MEKAIDARDYARGIRNNNPGNIKASDQFQWFGQRGSDADGYARFDSPVNGIRAMVIDLHTYYYHHGLHTVRGIITRWAPPETNDTADYIDDVANRMGVGADAPFSFWSGCRALVRAIIYHENGTDPYGEELLQKAFSSARLR